MLGVYFPIHQFNIEFNYKIHKTPIEKEIQTDIHFYTLSLVSGIDIDVEKSSFFSRRAKIPYQQLLIFLSFMKIFFKIN